MKPLQFSFELTPTDPTTKLSFEAWVNDQCVFDTDHVSEVVTVTGNLPNDDIEAEHSLKFVLKNKHLEHTQLDHTGKITKDACLTISNLTLDGFELNFDILQKAVYRHNFNNTADFSDDQFFGTMGCNGTVELKFSTPIYLWLLENM